MIGERKLDSCKDYMRELDLLCLELSKLAILKELTSFGSTLLKVTDAVPQNLDFQFLKASITKSNGKPNNRKTNKPEYQLKSKAFTLKVLP